MPQQAGLVGQKVSWAQHPTKQVQQNWFWGGRRGWGGMGAYELPIIPLQALHVERPNLNLFLPKSPRVFFGAPIVAWTLAGLTVEPRLEGGSASTKERAFGKIP